MRLTTPIDLIRLPVLALLLCALAQSARGNEPEFEAQTIDAEIEIGYGVAIGDVDGDGASDILVADKRAFYWYQNPTWEKRLFWKAPPQPDTDKVRDNVCIAVRDIDGDGKVEVAVGTNWNPGETVSEADSGGVWFVGSLDRIAPVKLPHEPTTHRMGWAHGPAGYSIVVVPLHGRGPVGENGSNIHAYHAGPDPYRSEWRRSLIENRLTRTHNFDRLPGDRESGDALLIGGTEGFRVGAQNPDGSWSTRSLGGLDWSAGEMRVIQANRAMGITEFTAIEPMHGNNVVHYSLNEDSWQRTVLDDRLHQGHALVVGDFLGTGATQIVAGWRNPDKSGKVGIRLYQKSGENRWSTHTIDDNSMACEDIKSADLDGDGALDLIASGRRTKNLVIYWNKRR